MKKVLFFLILSFCFTFSDTLSVGDVLVAEHQVIVEEAVRRPKKRFTSGYSIKLTDTIEVILRLNGVDQKNWIYSPSIPASNGKKLNFIMRMAIKEVDQ